MVMKVDVFQSGSNRDEVETTPTTNVDPQSCEAAAVVDMYSQPFESGRSRGDGAPCYMRP